jgi:hypothetical protein
MTPKEFAEKMGEIAKRVDDDVRTAESCHYEADDLMETVLSELGYEEGIKIFQEMEKWYS